MPDKNPPMDIVVEFNGRTLHVDISGYVGKSDDLTVIENLYDALTSMQNILSIIASSKQVKKNTSGSRTENKVRSTKMVN